MPKSLSEAVDSLYGTKVFPNVNPLVSSVGTSAVKIADNNNNRFSLLIVNLSANNIYIGLDNSVSSSKGIQLNANGGNVALKFRDDLNMVGWEFWAVAAGPGSNILVIETLAYGEDKGA